LNKLILGLVLTLLLPGCATQDLSPTELQQRKVELIERCKKLKKDLDDLKGKPLQRNAAIEYYQSECVSRTDAAFYEF